MSQPMAKSSRRVVLGFSGLPRAQAFKRARWPQLQDSEYKITQGAEAAAALVVDGVLVAAAAEERFDGVRHSDAFPVGAIASCLAQAGLTASDLDVVAHGFSYLPERAFYLGQSAYYRDLYHDVLDPEVNRVIAEQALGIDLAGRFLPVAHHLAHAESAFVPSGFADALVVVSDGLGERHAATVMIADARGLETIATLPATASLGLLYGLFTMYLGFEFNDGEYKVMGLAPYGDAGRYGPLILEHWVQLQGDGRYAVPLLLENADDLDKETHRAALAAIERRLGPRR
ncbi:MAG: carbamoyltransferase, partial [Myxococcales bacterium]|nr:carbamoyltransferase [Myxococcales bacterium]